MFNTRGGFSGQRPMGAPRMNQPPINHHGMNMSGMNMPSMNMPSLGMPSISQPSMNLGNISQPPMNPSLSRVGPLGMSPSMGLANLNPPPMNISRMGLPGLNQGGMGFQTELKSQGFNLRPMDSPGSFLGGNPDSMGMKSMPLRAPMHSAPPAIPQHFPPPTGPMTPAPPRMGSQSQDIPIINRVLGHSSDHLLGKVNPPLQDTAHIMKEKLGAFGSMSQDMGMKPGPLSSLDSISNTQKRYTNESASSILESFGLSNEDLEELSRYPDDQLTPMNLPNILRDIRLRKGNRPGVVHDQAGRGRRPGEVVPSKVIDYGHSSKYQIDNPSSRPFEPSRTDQKPTVSKEPIASKNNQTKTPTSNVADNKIPTISISRKQTPWQTPKPNRSNNKPLVGDRIISKAADGSVNVLTAENPVIANKHESKSLTDIPVGLDTPAVDSSKVNTSAAVGQGNFLSSPEAPAPGQGSWGPSQNQEDAQKGKRMPTPSMMNDYFASSPRIFPHICSLCNIECRHLKDWIKHQNNTSHIENCRKLCQQYPDWNPQIHTPRDTDVKNEAGPRKSRSKSRSPRRARRSGSRHRTRRARSRSPKPPGRRSRSRSPRRSRPSPGKSRSPLRGARSPRHSQSPRRYRRARSNSSPDKKAVDTVVQNFIETNKLKSGERGRAAKPSSDEKTSSNVKDKNSTSPSKTSSSSNSAARRPSSSSNHSNSSKKPASSSSNSSVKKSTSISSSSATRRPLSASRRTTPSTSTSKKPVVSTGAKKTTASISVGKKIQPINQPVSQKDHARPPPSESCSILNKFSGKECSGKIIHVTNLPESGYTDQDILKLVQPFGKVCDILIVRSRNEAFLETNFREAATAAIKYSETVPLMINNKVITLSLAGQKNNPPGGKRQRPVFQKRPGKPVVQLDKKPEPKKPEPKTPSVTELKSKHQTAAPSKEQGDKSECPTEKKPLESKSNIVVPPGFIKAYQLADPPYKDSEKCVVVLLNLPEKPSSVDEISNLAKPFGGVNDILVISNHRKAYLELTSRNSVDSMLKFYDVFPVYLGGKLLKISAATKYKNLKDENRIFTEIIQEAKFKINPTIYEKFVHVSNLPEKDLEDFDVFKIGLRFGQVEHYAVFSNKRKAILHMGSASAARAMCRFLYQYPATIGGSTVKCFLAKKTKLAENEYSTCVEEAKESSDQAIAALTPDEVEDETMKKNDVKEKTSKQADVKEKTSKQADAKEGTSKQADAKEGTSKQADAKEGTSKQADAKEGTSKQADAKEKTSKEAEVKEKTSKVAEVKEKVGHQDDFKEKIGKQDDVKEKMDKEDGQITRLDSLTQGSEMDVDAAGDLAKSSSVLSQCEDDDLTDEDEEEEAAEAPEAPESSSFIFIQPEPILSKEYNTNPQVYVSEESDVLVSVESDEESETEVPAYQNVKPLICSTEQKAARGSGGHDSDIEESPNDIPCDLELETAGDSQNSSSQEHEAERNEESDSGADASEVPGSTSNHSIKGGPGGSSVRAEDSDKESKSSNTSRKGSSKHSEEKSKEGRERARHSSHTRSRDETGRASDLALTRTAKYNPQRGDISVTLTVDSHKSSSRTDPRKRPSGERGSLGRDGSTPKSSSNRSSPSENPSSNSKVTSHQTKSTGRGVASRSREIDTRSSNKKDDRSKGGSSSSARHTRSSKGSSRGPRSNDEDNTFPFNLDEFVTVDEIVEEHRDSSSKGDDDGQKSQTASTLKRGKRKENYPPSTLDAKKTKGAQELSFVTLDEVGDDDNSATTADSSHIQKDKSLLADEIPSDKESQILVTLDEISDDEDVTTSVKQPPTSAMLSKDQLLTLDEVSAEDEEQTSHFVPSKPKRQPRQKKNKEEKIRSESEAKENLEATDAPKAVAVQGRPPEKPLLTLDEIEADDDDEEEASIGDMGHRFLTVDEIGQDEDDLETEDAEKSRAGSSSGQHSKKTSIKPPQPAARIPAGKRGRPKKRPLPDTPDDSKDSSGSEKTPVKPKAKAFRGSNKGEESSTPNKSEADVSTSEMETPAKKTKLDSPASGGAKLSPFNSSIPVGMKFMVPKTGYFCELCSLFYMDNASKLKHCKSLRHYQAVQKHLAKEEETEELGSCST